ncbi:hypothetical protein ACJX0J_022670, partial [Zea mays]
TTIFHIPQFFSDTTIFQSQFLSDYNFSRNCDLQLWKLSNGVKNGYWLVLYSRFH